jgi:hypothetical protein
MPDITDVTNGSSHRLRSVVIVVVVVVVFIVIHCNITPVECGLNIATRERFGMCVLQCEVVIDMQLKLMKINEYVLNTK